MILQLAFLVAGAAADLAHHPGADPRLHLRRRRKNRRGMRFTNTSMLDVVVPKQSQWRRHLAVALSLLSLITLTAAFARPKTQIDVPRERATVVMVIDASLSMQATDVKPTRLDAAKQAAIDFVTTLPEKYNVSVVSMAGSAAILVPPTTAHNTVENAINSIQLQESTAIGEGIATGAVARSSRLPRIRTTRTRLRPGAIVLLSDGKNTTGRAPLQAAAEAKAAKVPIYTIAYGTENGFVDLDGKREPVPVDHEEMQPDRRGHQWRVLRGGHGRSAEEGVPEHRLRRRLREGRPRGDRPLCWLRPGAGRARRPGCDLAGSKMAVMRLRIAPCSVAAIRPRRLGLPPGQSTPGSCLGSGDSLLSEEGDRDDSAALVSCAEPAVAAGADSAAGRAVPVAGAAQAEPQKPVSQTMFDLVIPRDRTWLRHRRRRSVDPQPADLDGGLRQAERSGLGAAGAGDHRGDHRRVAVHGGQDVDPNRLDAAKAAAEQFVNIPAA